MKKDEKARALALELRKKGLSYNEIRKQVPVSKSSLSLWLKHVRLAKRHCKRLYTKQITALSRGAPSQHERRKMEIEKIIANAKLEVQLPLSEETFRFFGAALYWAEGTKSKSFEITNSDPALIAFMVKWFKHMFDISPQKLKARLNIYPQQNERHIKHFWSRLTEIPLGNFGKSFIKPINKGYKKNNLYYGTIKITVAKGTDMRYRTFGWVQGALQDVIPHIESVQQKWSFLKKNDRPAVNVPPIA